MPDSQNASGEVRVTPVVSTESGFPRLIGAALKRERKRTEQLLDELRGAISAEIAQMEERVQRKLEDIDASLSLIAGELSQQGGEQDADGSD